MTAVSCPPHARGGAGELAARGGADGSARSRPCHCYRRDRVSRKPTTETSERLDCSHAMREF